MRVIKKAELIKPHGSKNLRLELSLCEQGAGRFVVNYRQELADGSFYDGSLTVYPVSSSEAERIFQRTLQNKLNREGHQPIQPGSSANGSSTNGAVPPRPAAPASPRAAPPATPPKQGARASREPLSPEERKARARRRLEAKVLANLQLSTGSKGRADDPAPERLCSAA